MKVVCPHCKVEVEWKENPHRPFCSEHCRSADLGNWATERYKIAPVEDSDHLVPVTKNESPEE